MCCLNSLSHSHFQGRYCHGPTRVFPGTSSGICQALLGIFNGELADSSLFLETWVPFAQGGNTAIGRISTSVLAALLIHSEHIAILKEFILSHSKWVVPWH